MPHSITIMVKPYDDYTDGSPHIEPSTLFRIVVKCGDIRLHSGDYRDHQSAHREAEKLVLSLGMGGAILERDTDVQYRQMRIGLGEEFDPTKPIWFGLNGYLTQTPRFRESQPILRPYNPSGRIPERSDLEWSLNYPLYRDQFDNVYRVGWSDDGRLVLFGWGMAHWMICDSCGENFDSAQGGKQYPDEALWHCEECQEGAEDGLEDEHFHSAI